MTMFKVTPSTARQDLIDCMEAGLVPFLTSSPGLGKSSIAVQIANDFNLEVIDVRLSQCTPEDLMGLPMREGNKAFFASFNMFPTEDMEVPPGKNGWLLLLDEFNSAPKTVQAASYKIVLDGMVGQAKLHEDVYIIAAGNLATDRAIVNQLSTAMQSRVVHLEMEANLKDFMDYAVKADFDSRILGFLEFQPSKLHSFKPDHNDKTFACPRTWEFASRLIKGKPLERLSLPLLAGTLSEGVAVELHTFIKEFQHLPRYEQILESPKTLAIPPEPSTKYALITMLADKVVYDDLDKIFQFVERLPAEFQAVFFRTLYRKDPKFKKSQFFSSNINKLTRFLYDDAASTGIAA